MKKITLLLVVLYCATALNAQYQFEAMPDTSYLLRGDYTSQHILSVKDSVGNDGDYVKVLSDHLFIKTCSEPYWTSSPYAIMTSDSSGRVSACPVDSMPFLPASAATPPGVINMYAGASAPTGYLLCDGAAVSRTTYAALFAVVSTTYGAGNGSTTFNLPDLRQRFPLGKATSGTGSTLGATGGTIDHVHAVDPPNTTSTGPSSTVINIDLVGTGMAAGDTATHDVNIPQFNSGTANPPFTVVNYIIKY